MSHRKKCRKHSLWPRKCWVRLWLAHCSVCCLAVLQGETRGYLSSSFFIFFLLTYPLFKVAQISLTVFENDCLKNPACFTFSTLTHPNALSLGLEYLLEQKMCQALAPTDSVRHKVCPSLGLTCREPSGGDPPSGPATAASVNSLNSWLLPFMTFHQENL